MNSLQGTEYVRCNDAHFSHFHDHNNKDFVQKYVKHTVFVEKENTYNYTIEFDKDQYPLFKNVTSVELKAIAFPKMDNNDHYFIMDIEECRSPEHLFSEPKINQSFAMVYYDNTMLGKNEIKPMKGPDFYEKKTIFDPPLNVLNKITVTFKKSNGDTILTGDFADLTDEIPPKKPHSFLLEITTLL